MEIGPALALLPLLEVFVACPDRVRRHIRIQMVNVMVLDSIDDGLEHSGDVQECTAFQGRSGEVPFLLPLPVGQVD